MLSYRRAALISAAMAFALTACGRLTVMPPPEGEPVILKPAELVTTWTDADGGTLTLKQDGTFVADKICIAVAWYEELAWSGTGTWKHGSNKEQSFLDVSFDADHPEVRGRESDAYSALKQGKALKLWAAIGDPDNDYPNCVLTSQAS
ncbi:hypothetical protein [Streptomyces sp. NBC_00572]|uniref:hypothetical protein n=1 Tax=Streptomyces sp. NBC_00572 TaxID=2903664 RepID=UPI00225A11CE|nr:hypothetical protein [Streptomyces sp. NBC_00572]MCX4982689.1 hypothetical protein [Streptomyces sp. NBC_00572]